MRTLRQKLHPQQVIKSNRSERSFSTDLIKIYKSAELIYPIVAGDDFHLWSLYIYFIQLVSNLWRVKMRAAAVFK